MATSKNSGFVYDSTFITAKNKILFATKNGKIISGYKLSTSSVVMEDSLDGSENNINKFSIEFNLDIFISSKNSLIRF